MKEELSILHQEENKMRSPERRYIYEFSLDPQKQLINFNLPSEKQSSPVSFEVLEFMHLLMDECTHLVNFDVPIDTNLVNVIAANDDAYVLRDGVNDFNSIWPG